MSKSSLYICFLEHDMFTGTLSELVLVIDIGITFLIYLRVLLGTNYYTQKRSWKRVVRELPGTVP